MFLHCDSSFCIACCFGVSVIGGCISESELVNPVAIIRIMNNVNNVNNDTKSHLKIVNISLRADIYILVYLI